MADVIDYNNLLSSFPWIISKNQRAVLSPDCDGFLCGLLMSHFLNWQIVGFYDGKVLLLNKDLSAKECVFLDMEIFRKNIRSVDHHMLMFDARDLPSNWHNFTNCIQPNNIRGFDYLKTFQLKYPLGTIHFLIGILGQKIDIDIPETAICPLLYADGTFKNLFNYPENCLSWLHFLEGDYTKNPLYNVFFNDYYSVTELMRALKDLFQKLGEINNNKRGGDKLKISNSKGEFQSFELKNGSYVLANSNKVKIEKLLELLSNFTKWKYNPGLWQWENMKVFTFSKSSINPRKKNYYPMIGKNPLSYAITSTLDLEYTIESPDLLP